MPRNYAKQVNLLSYLHFVLDVEEVWTIKSIFLEVGQPHLVLGQDATCSRLLSLYFSPGTAIGKTVDGPKPFQGELRILMGHHAHKADFSYTFIQSDHFVVFFTWHVSA